MPNVRLRICSGTQIWFKPASHGEPQNISQITSSLFLAITAAEIKPRVKLALQLLCWEMSESMGNHDSKIVDAGSVD